MSAIAHIKSEMAKTIKKPTSNWRCNLDSFHEDTGLGIGPGLIDFSPAWFESGHGDQICAA